MCEIYSIGMELAILPYMKRMFPKQDVFRFYFFQLFSFFIYEAMLLNFQEIIYFSTRAKMKVLFLVPNWGLHELKYTTATVKAPCTQPLEFMYIAKLLNTNCEYDFLDANLEGLSWEEIKNEITKYRAEVQKR